MSESTHNRAEQPLKLDYSASRPDPSRRQTIRRLLTMFVIICVTVGGQILAMHLIAYWTERSEGFVGLYRAKNPQFWRAMYSASFWIASGLLLCVAVWSLLLCIRAKDDRWLVVSGLLFFVWFAMAANAFEFIDGVDP